MALARTLQEPGPGLTPAGVGAVATPCQVALPPWLLTPDLKQSNTTRAEAYSLNDKVLLVLPVTSL